MKQETSASMDWTTVNGVDSKPPVLDRISPMLIQPQLPLNGNAHEHAAQVVPHVANGVETDPPAAPYIECLADVRVLAQTVVITDLSFINEAFKVHTELSIVPLSPDLTSINLHLGSCALLPNESGNRDGQVVINDIVSSYTRIEPSTMASQVSVASLGEAGQKMYNSLKNGDAQLQITIPNEVIPFVQALRCLKVCIDITVRRPKYGVQFSHSFARDGSMEKGAHVFTYKSSLLSSTREWLPCLDAPDQLALWRFRITCEASHTAVASAELVEVEMTSDMREKTYHYQQSVPTSACNMGWAIGQFSAYGHPDMAEVTSFALPGLLSLVKHTVSPLDKVLEYFEELLSCRYPYPSYKQVFVDKTPDEVTAYSSLTIYSVNVLYHKKIIDVVQESRQLLAFGVAQQFFGCFISPSHWLDWWLVKSLARFITSLYIEKIFGTSEFLFQIKKILNTVCDYESQWGKIVLRPQLHSPSRNNLHIDPRHELTCSPLYADAMAKKGHLTMRMLSKRLGHEPFFQVLHKILTVGQQMCERRDRPASWTHMVVSTESFFRTVTNVTGHEIPTFLEQWIYTGGHASFQVQYTFNRKRNMIELEVKQEVEQGNGRQRYVGPLTVVVQELDGSFSHTVQIDGDTSRSDLQCHSKGRRQKRKRVPLYTGEEVEVDLTSMDPDSPVLWIRVDPELLLLRNLIIRQPNYQWEYMLKYERDVLAQLQALERLQQFPSAQSKNVLVETISNENFFYRVRCRAAYSLTAVLNRMAETCMPGIPAIIHMFRDTFGSKSCAAIPRSNNFVATSQYLQQYFLMQALPQAVARMRTNGMCQQEVQSFILDLIRFNDNSTNRYSDDHYRTALINALSATIVPANNLGGGGNRSPETLSYEMGRVLQEITLALNMDTLKPSFGRVVGIAALSAIYQLQRNGHIPSDSKVFWQFAASKICVQMRKAALYILVDRVGYVRDRTSLDDIMRLLAMAADDPDPAIRIYIPTILSTTPPFTTYNSTDIGPSNPCNTRQVADELWNLISNTNVDNRVRLLFADVYFSLYGLSLPFVKSGPAMAPGHHRAYGSGITSNTSGGTANWHNAILDGDQPSSPVGRMREDSFNEDMLQ